MDPKIAHIRDEQGHPYGTVAYTTDETGITYGIAMCHPNDNFRKITGRHKAVGRYHSKNFKRFVAHSDINQLTHEDIVTMIVDDYMKNQIDSYNRVYG